MEGLLMQYDLLTALVSSLESFERAKSNENIFGVLSCTSDESTEKFYSGLSRA